MKIFCVIGPIGAFAQLPYTSANAVPGHIIRTYDFSKNDSLNGMQLPFETAGSAVTWDLSAIPLTVPNSRAVHYEPPAATPYQASYPAANVVVWEEYANGSRDYNYFNNSPFELRLLGGVHVADGDPNFITFCPDPFLIMDYPMGVGSGVQQVYNCPQAQGEVDHWVIMATGDLIYENGSMNDLVLWRSIYTTNTGYKDTSFFWTEYDNVLYPVARFDPGISFKVWEPTSTEVVGIAADPILDAGIQIYPNPAVTHLQITAKKGIHALNGRILDAQGRTIRDLGLLNSFPATVETTGLAPGAYVLELRDEKNGLLKRPFVRQ